MNDTAVYSAESIADATLTANTNSANQLTTVVLTATSPFDVQYTGYKIVIEDVDSNSITGYCTSGTSCSVGVSFAQATTHHYIAWVGYWDGNTNPTNLQTNVTDPVAVSWHPWPGMSVAVDQPTHNQLTNATVTATSPFDVQYTGYKIVIEDVDSNSITGYCTSGTSCSVGVSFAQATTHHYIAWVGYWDGNTNPTNLQTNVTDPVAVSWHPWPGMSVAVDQPTHNQLTNATVTATSPFDVQYTGYKIVIEDVDSNSITGYCTSGTSCSVGVSFAQATTHHYIAWVGYWDGNTNPTNLQTNVTDPVAVSWHPWPGMSVAVDQPTHNQLTNATVTATSPFDVQYTGYKIVIEDVDSNSITGYCTSGTSCSVGVSFAQATTHHYIAWVGYWDGNTNPTNLQTNVTDPVAVSWHPWPGMSVAVDQPTHNQLTNATVTATSPFDVQYTGYKIVIEDVDSNSITGYCTSGTSCSVGVSFAQATTHHYIAWVGYWDGNTNPTNLQTNVTDPVAVSWHPWPGMSVAVDQPTHNQLTNATVTATSPFDVQYTGYKIVIEDVDSNSITGYCTSGTSCSVGVSFAQATTHHYIAWVGYWDGNTNPTNLQTNVTDPVAVSWHPWPGMSVAVDQPTHNQLTNATVTATSPFDVQYTGYKIVIEDVDSNSITGYCTSGTSCSVGVSFAQATTHHYIAWVGYWDGNTNPTNLQTNVTDPVAVSWHPWPAPTISAQRHVEPIGATAVLTATSPFDVQYTGYKIVIEDVDSNSITGYCTSGTSCSVGVSFAQATTHHYIAWVGYWDGNTNPTNLQTATSNSFEIRWEFALSTTPFGTRCSTGLATDGGPRARTCITISSSPPPAGGTAARADSARATRSNRSVASDGGVHECPEGGGAADRLTYCFLEYGTLTVYDIDSGAELGGLTFGVDDAQTLDASAVSWTNQLYVTPNNDAWGLAVGSFIEGGAGCNGTCATNDADFPTEVFDSYAVEATATYSADSPVAGSSNYSDSGMYFRFSNDAWISDSTDIVIVSDEVRCDDALSPNAAGCVYYGYRPIMRYGLSGPFPQLAHHILNAQQSGLPGSSASGAPLTRGDSTSSTRNGDAACPRGVQWLPRPNDYSCDEYPFRSTNEGAYGQAERGFGPRTFAGCQVDLSLRPRGPGASTGPSGWSICMIDATQNSVGGNQLAPFYRKNRVLVSDPFYVDIDNGSE